MRRYAGFFLITAIAGCSSNHDDNAGKPDAGFTINGHPFSDKAEGAGLTYTNNDVSKPDSYYVELYNSANDGCQQFMSNHQTDTVLQLKFKYPLKFGDGPWNVGGSNTTFIVNGDPFAAQP